MVSLYNQKTQAKIQLAQYPCAIPEKQLRQSVYIIHRHGEREGLEIRAIAKALRSLKVGPVARARRKAESYKYYFVQFAGR